MGADFIMAAVDLSEPKNKWAERFDAMLSSTVLEFVSYADAWYQSALDPDDPEFVSEIRSLLLEALEVSYDGKRRDCAVFYTEGSSFSITGGTTWGDDPTEAYRYLSLMQSFQHWWFS